MSLETASGQEASGPLAASVPEDPSVRLGFSDREEVGNVSWRVGVGDVAGARAALTTLVGVGPEDVVAMEQVHGSGVARVGPDDRGRGATSARDGIRGVDALVTTATDLALLVLVADCVPVLLVDPGRAVGAVHAGRRGVATGVVAAAVEALTDRPGEVVAVVGPSIGGCCYEVEPAVVDEVARVVPAARTRTRWDSPGLDLPLAASSQLADAGVGRIERAGACTLCTNGRWFSHRAADAGRQAGIVVRRADRESSTALSGTRGADPLGVQPDPA